MPPITHNGRSKLRYGIIMPGNAAFDCDLPVPVTVAATDPIVAVGTPACVTICCASEASAAKPTEAGFARKTEYTFLRNVSPMIHAGPILLELLENVKMDPRHWLLDTCCNLKSLGEMDQVWPPKESVTLTVVEQANKTGQHTVHK